MKCKKHIIYIVSSFIIGLLLFYNSPLYNRCPLFDLSVYIDIGRAINSGKIMYTDIYDTKGPFWYILCSIITAIPIKSVVVWFIFDCIIMYFIMILFDKIISIRKQSSILFVILINIYIVSIFVFNMIDTNSEYRTLPIILSIIYLIVRSIETNTVLTNNQICLIGFLSSSILFIKYTSIITPFIFIIYYFIKKRFNILSFLKGCLITILLVSIYFIVNHNFIDYLKVQKSVILTHVITKNNYPKLLYLIILLFIFIIPFILELYTNINIYRLLFIINALILMICINSYLYYYIILVSYIPLVYFTITKINIQQIIVSLYLSIVCICSIILSTILYNNQNKNLKNIYNSISKYESIYVSQFPEYQYYKNEELPYYFDVVADYDNYIIYTNNIISTEQYDYLCLPIQIKSTKYEFINTIDDSFYIYKKKSI